MERRSGCFSLWRRPKATPKGVQPREIRGPAGPPLAPGEHLVACRTCGLIQIAPPISGLELARCARCARVVLLGPPRGPGPTLFLVLGAALLFVPAHAYPILRTLIWGRTSTYTVLESVEGIADAGSYVVAGLILVTAVLSPAFEILGLIYLTLRSPSPRRTRGRALVHRTISLISPWNMLIVYLASILIALGQLRLIARITPEPGLFYFAGMVLLLLTARFTLDRRLVWSRSEAAA